MCQTLPGLINSKYAYHIAIVIKLVLQTQKCVCVYVIIIEIYCEYCF